MKVVGYQNLWYSFDYGLVHVVVINTETDFPSAPSGPNTALNGGNFEGLTGQLNWFQNDLSNANANRANVPWIVVTGHRPFYASVPTTGAASCSACASAFIPSIIQYNVDLYISGHIHWYERLYPINANGTVVANNYTNTSGFIHITNGAGGAAEGSASVGSKISASAKIVTGYGYLQLQIINASTSNSNTLSDSVNITRHH
jgi:acid phosphatase